MGQNIIDEFEFVFLTSDYFTEQFTEEEFAQYLPKGMIDLTDLDNTDWDAIETFMSSQIQLVEYPQILSIDSYYNGLYESELVFKKNDKYYNLTYTQGDTAYYTLRNAWEREDYSITEVIPVEKTIIEYIPKYGNTYISE